MNRSYIPRKDVDYHLWLHNFGEFVAAHGAGSGLPPDMIADLTAAVQAWNDSYAAHLAAQTAAKSMAAAKAADRAASERLARHLAQMIQDYPTTTDALRRQAGLTPLQEEAASGSEPDVVTSPAPNLRLDWSLRGRITIHFGPRPETPRRNGLPVYAKGARLEYVLGGEPTADADWQPLANVRHSPYVHVLAVSQPTAVAYRAQYVDRAWQVGPWSDPVQATVTV